MLRQIEHHLWTKSSRKLIRRTKLRNIFLRNRSCENKINFNKQRNCCISLLTKAKIDHYGNLDTKILYDNKRSWSSFEPYLHLSSSLRQVNCSLVTFTEEILKGKLHFLCSDSVLKTKMKFVNHPSINTTRDWFPNNNFSFSKVAKSDVRIEIINLNSAKVSQDSNIPTKLIKQNINIFSDVLHSPFNSCLENVFNFEIFASILKTADAISLFKKDTITDKNN